MGFPEFFGTRSEIRGRFGPGEGWGGPRGLDLSLGGLAGLKSLDFAETIFFTYVVEFRIPRDGWNFLGNFQKFLMFF